MPMLFNPFPGLFTYMLVAPLILRVVVGILFLLWGYRLFTKDMYEPATIKMRTSWGALGTSFLWYLGTAELLTGALLIFGAFTQIAAVLGILVAAKLYYIRGKYPSIANNDRQLYVVIAAVCVALLFLGAGAYALDFPQL